MDRPKFEQHGGPHPSRRPYWKRLHHSRFFWISAFLIMLAMVIYVLSGNLAYRPGRPVRAPEPAIAP